MSIADIGWFSAELAAYAALVAWALARGVRGWRRVLLAVAAPGSFAAAWGMFAAPQATLPLTGAAEYAFRAAWFAAAAFAGWCAIRDSNPEPAG